MYIPGRSRMWAVSRNTLTLSGVYLPDATPAASCSAVSAPLACPFSPKVSTPTPGVVRESAASVRALSVMLLSSRVLVLIDHTRAEAQVGQGGPGQLAAQPFQQPS